jgi:hypothetical protein
VRKSKGITQTTELGTEREYILIGSKAVHGNSMWNYTVLRNSITLMGILIQILLFTLMRIGGIPFSLMQIRILSI